MLTLLSAGIGLQHVDAQPQASEAAQRNVAVNLTSQPLPDGVYLYGDTQQPGQPQTEYFVFRLQDNQVVGAFYMPRSSFDCFRGDLKASQLDLTVVTSYEEQAYDYQVSLNAYHPIEQVSASDHKILQTCQADTNLAALE